jgi:hypothetical protein
MLACVEDLRGRATASCPLTGAHGDGLKRMILTTSPAASRMSDHLRAALSKAVCCESKNA